MTKAREFRSKHLFRVQLSTHDRLFDPVADRRMPGWRLWHFVFLVCASIIFGFPSFEIAVVTTQPPDLELPDRIDAGELLVLTPSPNLVAPRLAGRELALIEGRENVLVAAPLGKIARFSWEANSTWDASSDSIADALERAVSTVHPKYAIRFKDIEIVNDSAESQRAIASETPTTSETPGDVSHATIDPQVAKILAEETGTPTWECFKEPSLIVDPKAPLAWRHAAKHVRMQRPYAIRSVGYGRVAIAESIADGKGRVILDHGGGLHSRFESLREVRVKVGDRVDESDIIATVDARRNGEIDWNLYLSGTPLKSQSFLALSSRLCGSR